MSRYVNPWLEIQNMREEIDRIMDESRDWSMGRKSEKERFALWSPVADVYETGGHYVVELELPGVDQEKVSLESKAGQLFIYGEKRIEKDASGSAYQMLERSYGPFSRKFRLPGNVDVNNIKAVLKNGVLTISIPKKETPKASSVNILID